MCDFTAMINKSNNNMLSSEIRELYKFSATHFISRNFVRVVEDDE